MQLRLIRHETVDSTSERAFAGIASGEAQHGDVHIASAQTAGRGRLGRSWASAGGEGLYLSLVLLPPPPPWNPAALTMAAGLAAFDAAEILGVRGARLKWPNDLMVGDAKLAGVLVETRGFDPAKPHYVVGLGFNVLQRTFPAELLAERQVASLATLGLEVTVEVARRAVLDALRRRVGRVHLGHAELAADFLRATRLAGATVRVQVGEVEHEGQLESVSVARGVCVRCRDENVRHFPLEIVRALSTSL
jgi:BirA family biotin operon repressor/biotin-[acetyl-CoA-carboxylase] ligase